MSYKILNFLYSANAGVGNNITIGDFKTSSKYLEIMKNKYYTIWMNSIDMNLL